MTCPQPDAARTPPGGDLNLAGLRHVLVPAGQISIGKLIVLIEDSRVHGRAEIM